METYSEWQKKARTRMYELYCVGPGIGPIADKAIKAVKGVVKDPKSFLVVKFQGTKQDADAVEKALGEVNFRVVETEIEHD